MPEMMAKIRKLREIMPDLNIQVDGGLNSETTKLAGEAGANCIVAGTAVFQSSDPAKAIQQLRSSIETSQHNS